MTKKTITTKELLAIVEKQQSVIDKMLKGKSGTNTKSAKLEAKSDEWVELVESGKGKRTSLAPVNPDFENRGIIVTRFKKSIFVPAQDFEAFVADQEVALQKARKLGVIPA